MTSVRMSRKPLFTLLLLLLISCAIYFVSSGDAEALATLPKKAILDTKVDRPVQPQKGDTGKDKESIILEDPKENSGSIGGAGKNEGAGTKEEAESKEAGTKEEVANSDKYTETPFMPQMANATLKAALGNSAWHLLHTVLARYPDKPTEQEQATLKQYIHLFGQVYPCGDCARHFQKILAKHPVQTGSRKTAALWGCHVHNKVNERLHKPEYDCTTILEDYDCGCGDDEKQEDPTLGSQSVEHLREITVDEKPGKQLGG